MTRSHWPESERLYGSEVGCDLPPETRKDGDLWPLCVGCAVIFTRNFAGLCVSCRRNYAAARARATGDAPVPFFAWGD